MVSTSQTMFQRGSSCKRQERRVHQFNYNANYFKCQTAGFLRSLHMFAIKKNNLLLRPSPNSVSLSSSCCQRRRRRMKVAGNNKLIQLLAHAPSHPEVKGQEEAEGEDEPVGVWCSGSPLVLFVSITNQHFISAVVTFITGPHIKVTKC